MSGSDLRRAEDDLLLVGDVVDVQLHLELLHVRRKVVERITHRHIHEVVRIVPGARVTRIERLGAAVQGTVIVELATGPLIDERSIVAVLVVNDAGIAGELRHLGDRGVGSGLVGQVPATIGKQADAVVERVGRLAFDPLIDDAALVEERLVVSRASRFDEVGKVDEVHVAAQGHMPVLIGKAGLVVPGDFRREGLRG